MCSAVVDHLESEGIRENDFSPIGDGRVIMQDGVYVGVDQTGYRGYLCPESIGQTEIGGSFYRGEIVREDDRLQMGYQLLEFSYRRYIYHFIIYHFIIYI
jgi:hypothetical protein